MEEKDKQTKNRPCNPDHNGECLVCDCWLDNCAYDRYLNKDYKWETKEELDKMFGEDKQDEDLYRGVSETPHKWVVVKIENDGNEYYKVYGSWRGGYLDGDRWKMNSGISSIQEDEKAFFFSGLSGSKYLCLKGHYGIASAYTESVLENVITNSYKVDAKMEIMDAETDWMELFSKK